MNEQGWGVFSGVFVGVVDVDVVNFDVLISGVGVFIFFIGNWYDIVGDVVINISVVDIVVS